jgi:hypothetical protein
MKTLTIVIVFCTVLCTGAFAQPTNTQGNTPQVNWNEELKMAQEEQRALKNIIAAIESIDTARQSELIQFVITDRSIRSRVISALRKAGKNISASTSADLVVTQKPATFSSESGELNSELDLLRIVIESVGIYGAPTIKRILGEDLYKKINDRSGYEYTEISTKPAQEKIQYASISASVFGGDMVFKSGFGLGINLGNDVIGYPFWLPGNVGINGIIRKEKTNVVIGLNFPLGEAGITPFQIGNGFKIKERKLEGAQAFSARIDQQIGIIDNEKEGGRLSVGGELYNAFQPNINTFSARAKLPQYGTNYTSGQVPGVKKDSLFWIKFSGHGWVTYQFGEAVKGLYLQAGAGMHRVTASTVGVKPPPPGATENVEIINPKDYEYVDPLAKIGYIYTDQAGDSWGLSVQYCNTLLAEGFIRIFNWLHLTAKYSAIVGRDPRKWEQNDFVIISPVLKLNF